ncbi:MAG: thioredoxin family protein [candidate division WOR-3 bacterium]
MKIIIAGPGCPRCQATEKNVRDACAELGIACEITHLYDIKEFAKLGVMLTPAVIIDDKVVISGKVPAVEELIKILSEKK